MDNQIKIKCPRCGSSNVIIRNRGYSFLQGLAIGIVLVLLDWIYTIVNNSSAYSAMDEAGQTGFAFGLLSEGLLILIFGLLLGFIGKNKLVARCLKCKKNFDPSQGVTE